MNLKSARLNRPANISPTVQHADGRDLFARVDFHLATQGAFY